MSFTHGRPQRWQPADYKSRAPQVASVANSMPASASSAPNDKKKTKDKKPKDRPIKVVGTKPAQELEEDFQANEMSPTIKYARFTATAA